MYSVNVFPSQFSHPPKKRCIYWCTFYDFMWILNSDLSKLILRYLQIHIKTMDGNIANHAFLNTWLLRCVATFYFFFINRHPAVCVFAHVIWDVIGHLSHSPRTQPAGPFCSVTHSLIIQIKFQSYDPMTMCLPWLLPMRVLGHICTKGPSHAFLPPWFPRQG